MQQKPSKVELCLFEERIIILRLQPSSSFQLTS